MSFKEQHNLFSELNKILSEFKVEDSKYTLHTVTKEFIKKNNIDFEPYRYEFYVRSEGDDEGGSYLRFDGISIYDKDNRNLDTLVQNTDLDDDDKAYWDQYYITDYVDVPVGFSPFNITDLNDFNLKEKVQGVLNEF